MSADTLKHQVRRAGRRPGPDIEETPAGLNSQHNLIDRASNVGQDFGDRLGNPRVSAFIRRTISAVDKELICSVRGFSCSVNGMDSARIGMLKSQGSASPIHTATGNL